MAVLRVGAKGWTDQRWSTESIEEERRRDWFGERAREVIVSAWPRSEYEMEWCASEKTCTSLSTPPTKIDCPSTDHFTCRVHKL